MAVVFDWRVRETRIGAAHGCYVHGRPIGYIDEMRNESGTEFVVFYPTTAGIGSAMTEPRGTYVDGAAARGEVESAFKVWLKQVAAK